MESPNRSNEFVPTWRGGQRRTREGSEKAQAPGKIVEKAEIRNLLQEQEYEVSKNALVQIRSLEKPLVKKVANRN